MPMVFRASAMKNKLAIVIPVYNEEKVVKNVIEDLKKLRPDDVIIAVNDGSHDSSLSVLQGIANIYILNHELNLGQGASIQTGISFARQLSCKYVATFDSDGQHDPNDIEVFLNEICCGDLDVVIGSRFLVGSKTNISKFKRHFLKLSTLFTFFTSGIKLSDSHNGFRIINIADNPAFEIHHNGMSHASEIVDIISCLKLKYKELPCNIKYTDYSMEKGQSLWNSINIVLELLISRLIK